MKAKYRAARHDIARLAVLSMEHLKGNGNQNLIDAMSLVSKYFLIICLPDDARRDINDVVKASTCPLCSAHFQDQCSGCVFAEPPWTGCGELYRSLKRAVERGSREEAMGVLASITDMLVERYLYGEVEESSPRLPGILHDSGELHDGGEQGDQTGDGGGPEPPLDVDRELVGT